MLVDFTFENFRSFRDEKTLSMEDSSVRELTNALVHKGKYNLQPVAVMYGANSSGKSNVLKALMTMRNVMPLNVKLNPDDVLDYQQFELNRTFSGEPSSFEIQFIIDNLKYRYGFDYDKNHICSATYFCHS